MRGKNSRTGILVLSLGVCLVLFMTACAKDLLTPKIDKPDHYTHVYETKYKVALKAIAAVLEEKKIGKNIVIDYRDRRVVSDYVISGEWRTKTNAEVRQLNWKECKVTLTVITEKKTEGGWELHRLLDKDQYDTFFSVIEMKIYEEMAKVR